LNFGSNLIIKTFSRGALNMKEVRDLQKGILTTSVLESILENEGEITIQDFTKLLVHLCTITPYPSTVPGKRDERFFTPCVLNHIPEFTQEDTQEDLHTAISPLSVGFTHLMTPVSAEKPDISFSLIEKIFKDLDHDLSSHVEISFFPSLSDERDSSVSEVCSNIRQVIETSIQSLKDFHYSRDYVKPAMCFRCDHRSELHQVEKMRGKNCHRKYCSKARTNSPILPEGSCWFNEGQCDVFGCHLFL
jgi:hypothetical protein